MPNFTLRKEKGISIFVVKNAHPTAVKKIKLKYTIQGNTGSKTVDIVNELPSGKTWMFDLLKVPAEAKSIQVKYTLNGRSVECAIFQPDPYIHPNSYIRDFFYALSPNDSLNYYDSGFTIFDTASTTSIKSFSESASQFVSKNSEFFTINKKVKVKPKVKAIPKLSPIKVQQTHFNNCVFLDLRNEKSPTYNPPVENLCLNWVDQASGNIKTLQLLQGKWPTDMVRVDFVPGTYFASTWLTWNLGTATITTIRTEDILGLVWAEGIIHSDGESGGIWVWLNSLNVQTT